MENKIINKIRDDVKQSLLSGQKRRIEVLRYLLSVLQTEEIKSGESFDEQAALAALQKEMKRKNESLAAFKEGGRDDLVAEQEEEIKILEEYLPKALTKEEIIALVKEIAAEKGITDFGLLMREAMAQLKGKADGQTVSLVVKEILS